MSSGCWSIDKISGHCHHPAGIDAYVGEVERGNYLPVIGPYTNPEFKGRERELAKYIFDLTVELEKFEKNKCIVWGGLDREHEGPPIKILNQNAHWIADPSARTNWALLALPAIPKACIQPFLEREFRNKDSEQTLSHFSGVTFRYSNDCFEKGLVQMLRKFTAEVEIDNDVDWTLWNSWNWEPGLHSLARAGLSALSLFRNLNISPRTVRISSYPQLSEVYQVPASI